MQMFAVKKLGFCYLHSKKSNVDFLSEKVTISCKIYDEKATFKFFSVRKF